MRIFLRPLPALRSRLGGEPHARAAVVRTGFPWPPPPRHAPRLYATAAPAAAPSAGRQPRPRRKAGKVLLALGAAVAVGWELDRDFNARTLERTLRVLYMGLALAVDYKVNFDPDSLEAIEALHDRCANRILQTCERNGGLYVKLGQAIGSNAVILPKPYKRLTKLFDNAEKMPFETVRHVVGQELGRPLEEVFCEFDSDPVGAASIAQVHVARLHPVPGQAQGQVVAVKVQRPEIRKQAKADLWCFRVLLRLYERVFELPLSFAGQYISDQIEKETRFDLEAENARLARGAIKTSSTAVVRNTCYVPWVSDEWSTPRLLVEEYIGQSANLIDIERVRRMGLSTKAVAQSVMEVFADQIFQSGFVQADGHPANILVRKHPDADKHRFWLHWGARYVPHQVVLIDHGLYVHLSAEFRREYAELWRAIWEVDVPVLEKITTHWGMDPASADLFASATLMRPWSRGQKETEMPDETSELSRQRGMKDKLKSFLVNVELVPKELIFVSRSMRIVQANNQALGSPVNRLNVLARHAADALIQERTSTLWKVISPPTNESQDLSARFREWATNRRAYITFHMVLLLVDVAFQLSRFAHWFRWVFSYLPFTPNGPRTRGGFEDDLEAQMRELARNEFGVELDADSFV